MPSASPLRPDRVFLSMMAIFGTLMVFLTPPMQAADEPNHLYRIWQLCQGHWVSPNYQATVPVDLDRMTRHYARDHLRPSPWLEFQRIRRDFYVPLDAQPTLTVPIPNTSLYSPITYLPDIVGGEIARAFHCSAAGFLYCARLASFLCYAGLGWLTIQILPLLKWPACLILASPMALFQATALSADGMAIATCTLAVAIALRIALQQPPVSAARIAALALAMAAMTLCKSAYAPIIVIVLGIPRQRWRRPWLYPLTIFLICAALSLAWMRLVRPAGGVLTSVPQPTRQLHWVAAHPFQTANILLYTIWNQCQFYLRSYVGYFGWLDVSLPIVAVYLYAAFFLTVTLSTGDPMLVPIRMRLAAAAAFAITLIAVFLSQYVLWSSYRAPLIDGVQGRYFLPMALLVSVVLQGRMRHRWPDRVVTLFIAGYLFAASVTIYQYFFRW